MTCMEKAKNTVQKQYNVLTDHFIADVYEIIDV